MIKLMGLLVAVLALVGLGLVGPAHAALTAPDISTADFYTVAGAVLAALAIIFSVRKGFSLLR